MVLPLSTLCTEKMRPVLWSGLMAMVMTTLFCEWSLLLLGSSDPEFLEGSCNIPGSLKSAQPADEMLNQCSLNTTNVMGIEVSSALYNSHCVPIVVSMPYGSRACTAISCNLVVNGL